MKTLILNGSPRVKGNCTDLITAVTEGISGEHKIVDAYRCSVSPCVDCRYCWKNEGCAINDGMQEIYDYIQECDNILIVSPIYFSELTGKLLDLGSRLQTYFSSKYLRKEEPVKKPKKGAVIVVGGGNGPVEKPYGTAQIMLHDMNCYNIHPVVSSLKTDQRPAIEDEECMNGVRSIIEFFNQKL